MLRPKLDIEKNISGPSATHERQNGRNRVVLERKSKKEKHELSGEGKDGSPKFVRPSDKTLSSPLKHFSSLHFPLPSLLTSEEMRGKSHPCESLLSPASPSLDVLDISEMTPSNDIPFGNKSKSETIMLQPTKGSRQETGKGKKKEPNSIDGSKKKKEKEKEKSGSKLRREKSNAAKEEEKREEGKFVERKEGEEAAIVRLSRPRSISTFLFSRFGQSIRRVRTEDVQEEKHEGEEEHTLSPSETPVLPSSPPSSHVTSTSLSLSVVPTCSLSPEMSAGVVIFRSNLIKLSPTQLSEEPQPSQIGALYSSFSPSPAPPPPSSSSNIPHLISPSSLSPPSLPPSAVPPSSTRGPALPSSPNKATLISPPLAKDPFPPSSSKDYPPPLRSFSHSSFSSSELSKPPSFLSPLRDTSSLYTSKGKEESESTLSDFSVNPLVNLKVLKENWGDMLTWNEMDVGIFLREIGMERYQEVGGRFLVHWGRFVLLIFKRLFLLSFPLYIF